MKFKPQGIFGVNWSTFFDVSVFYFFMFKTVYCVLVTKSEPTVTSVPIADETVSSDYRCVLCKGMQRPDTVSFHMVMVTGLPPKRRQCFQLR